MAILAVILVTAALVLWRLVYLAGYKHHKVLAFFIDLEERATKASSSLEDYQWRSDKIGRVNFYRVLWSFGPLVPEYWYDDLTFLNK